MNKQADERLIKNIEKISPGGRLAIVLCASAFRFGGNWGFIKREKQDFLSQIETLKGEKPNVKAIPVANGALVLCDENFLAHNVNLAVPNAINRSFVEMVTERQNQERALFAKFFKNVVKGESRHVKKTKDGQEITVGIFSVNDTNLIRINGVDYPAYKLSLVEALTYADQLAQSSGKVLYARAVTADNKEVFDKVKNLMNSKALAALYKGLEIAESDTGLFMTFRIKNA